MAENSCSRKYQLICFFPLRTLSWWALCWMIYSKGSGNADGVNRHRCWWWAIANQQFISDDLRQQGKKIKHCVTSTRIMVEGLLPHEHSEKHLFAVRFLLMPIASDVVRDFVLRKSLFSRRVVAEDTEVRSSFSRSQPILLTATAPTELNSPFIYSTCHVPS